MNNINSWLLLVTTLSTDSGAIRMRIWRAIQSSGAVVLRDGVYLLPVRERCQADFSAIRDDIRGNGGTAHLFQVEGASDTAFKALFDRTQDSASLMVEIEQLRDGLNSETTTDSLRQIRKCRKAFAAIEVIDFFPEEARKQAEAALSELELAVNRVLAPDEPQPAEGKIRRLQVEAFQECVWATRRRPWVD